MTAPGGEKPALVGNVADPKQVEKAGEKEKIRRRRELDDLIWVLSDPRGRRFVWRLLGKFGLFRSSFTGNSTTFFNEGERNAALFINTEVMEARPEAYLEMTLEHQKEDK